MQLLAGLPLLALIVVVFSGVLIAIVLLDRSRGATQPGSRLENYMNAASSSELSLDGLRTQRSVSRSAPERLLALVSAAAPEKLRSAVAKDLEQAQVKMNPDVFIGIRALLLFGAPVLGLLWVLALPQKTVVHWVMVGMFALMAPRLPSIWLTRRVKDNQRAIDRALPYALDLMVACLEGGLSLEATLDKIATETDTLLSEEIRRSMAEIALGRPTAEALRDLAARTGVADLKRLTEAVLQADRMGVSVAEAMRTLADESRTKRRQQAEMQAQKAPIKMVPIIALTTLPAIGAIVLTPSFISLARLASMFAHK
jgi:tight adherence protein C